MVIRAFITHKQAELFTDCQDRFGVNPDTKSIAVSDGMGSTWQQKIWAQLLVETFIGSTDWYPSREAIKPLCKKWRANVSDFIQNLKDTNAPENMVYRNERNLAEGRSAGATFIGIRFNGNKWDGVVLGDSCLIEWDGIEAKFHTSQDVEAFDSYPDYFDSDESKEGKGAPKSIEGIVSEGKKLLLVSDPFSDFLLKHKKQGNMVSYIQQLLSLSSHEDFESLVYKWRKEGMHNDDTTLVIAENDNSEILTISHNDNIVEMIEKEKLSPNAFGKITEDKTTPKRNSFQGGKVDVGNFVGVQDNKKNFVDEFLTEYKRCLQKKFPKQMSKLKFKWIQKAAEEAFHILLEKYSLSKNSSYHAITHNS